MATYSDGIAVVAHSRLMGFTPLLLRQRPRCAAGSGNAAPLNRRRIPIAQGRPVRFDYKFDQDAVGVSTLPT